MARSFVTLLRFEKAYRRRAVREQIRNDAGDEIH